MKAHGRKWSGHSLVIVNYQTSLVHLFLCLLISGEPITKSLQIYAGQHLAAPSWRMPKSGGGGTEGHALRSRYQETEMEPFPLLTQIAYYFPHSDELEVFTF